MQLFNIIVALVPLTGGLCSIRRKKNTIYFVCFLLIQQHEPMADNNKPEVQSKQQKAPKEAKPKKKGFNLNDYPLPEYVQHRLQVWDEVKKSQEVANAGM